MDRAQSPSMASPHEYYSSSSEFPQYYEPQIVHPDQYSNSEGPRSNLTLGIPYPPTPHSGASPTNAFEYHRSSSLQQQPLHHQHHHHHSSHHLYGNGEPPSPGAGAVQNVSPPLTHMSASDLGSTDATGGGAPPPYSHSNDGTSSPASSHESARYRHHTGGHGHHQHHPHQQQHVSNYGPPPPTSIAPVQQAPSSLVHRRSHRGSNASSGGGGRTSTAAAAMPREIRRKARRSNSTVEDEFGSDEDDLGPQYSNEGGGGVTKRREEVRRQRIESEQRRRDELRDGYRKLKDVLPVSNQKSSKVSLLDRATTHIKQLEVTQAHVLNKIAELEAETARLRHVNETLMLSAAEVRRNSAGAY